MLVLGLAESSIQLVPDGTLFLHIAIIIVMVYVLNATLFRPINRILEERERQTRGHSGSAQGVLREVDESLLSYETSLREARVEGYHTLERERAEALTERQSGLDLVRAEATGLIEDEKRAIQTQTAEARETLGDDARRLATEISSQILHRPL